MISSTTRTAGPYSGNGTQTVFPFSFKVFQASDILVVQTDSFGNVTNLALTTNYNVTLNANQDTTPGGSVTMTAAPASGYTITLSSQVPALQGLNLTNAGNFYPSAVNSAFDYLTILIQQLYILIFGALKLPIGDPASSSIPSVANRANNLLGFDSNGNVVAVAPAAQSATALQSLLNGSGGANFVGFLPAGTGSVSSTVQAKLRETVSFTGFGGIGDNVTDNIASFVKSEASTAERIYLPEGTYYTTGAASLLQKYYYGPGKIRTFGGDNTPGRFTWRTNRPSGGTGTSYAKYFSADLSTCDASYQINSTNRVNLTEPYFAPETSHALSIYDNRAGSSGTLARLTVAALAGATSATLNSSAGISIGTVLGFNNGSGVITDTKTITGVAGNVVSWVGGLSQTYAIGYQVTTGTRTMNSQNHLELQHRAAGDAYINLYRVSGSYIGTAGQDHVYYRSTAGIDGGDMTAASAGIYFTGREVAFNDAGFDIAVISEVRTFNRSNNTEALGALWHGQTMNSAGTVPCNAAYILAGKWLAGLDTSRADLSVNGGCVLNMASDQYLYWGSTGSAVLYESWGRNRGPHRLGYNSGNVEIDATVNNVLALGIGQFRVTNYVDLRINGSVGFNNTAPIGKPTVTGAKGGNTALASLLTALAAYGLVTDSTT